MATNYKYRDAWKGLPPTKHLAKYFFRPPPSYNRILTRGHSHQARQSGIIKALIMWPWKTNESPPENPATAIYCIAMSTHSCLDYKSMINNSVDDIGTIWGTQLGPPQPYTIAAKGAFQQEFGACDSKRHGELREPMCWGTSAFVAWNTSRGYYHANDTVRLSPRNCYDYDLFSRTVWALACV